MPPYWGSQLSLLWWLQNLFFRSKNGQTKSIIPRLLQFESRSSSQNARLHYVTAKVESHLVSERAT